MNAASLNDYRCQFLFADGRRCRTRRTPQSDSLCLPHWRREQEQAAADRLGDEIVGPAGALNTQAGIHNALANVFCNLVRNRISPRSAAILGYVGQLMLGSAPSLERTIKSFLPLLQFATKVGHQNTQAKSISDLRFHKIALDEIEVTNALIGQFNLFKSMPYEDFLKFAKFCAAHVDKNEGKKEDKQADKKKEEAPSAKS